ncbi:hypothetical protein BBJ29_003233 [Phytophthora kernoviae]|uniref:HIT domain-containing protein n=1 Tax=Phytophthora kernoviae TaxID=325452 RepID=A0A3F2RRJ0_9STRA|nr:hypothetical protein BBJ29_003233 [Phytophthora kernoviae]RLN62833.1 hypothetical protein BBP00_00004508 [Phytophthora kernoviae]
MMLQFGKGALQRAAAEHNVRSILFHLTPATAQRAFVQEPGVQSAIRALKQHGYRLGFIGDVVAASNDTTNVLSAFNEVHNDKKNGASLYENLLNFDQCLDPTGRCFGPFRVLTSQVFYETTLSFALVNLKPIVQGHVLVVPKRPVARFEMLDTDEVSDLWTAAQCVGKQVESHYGASSLTFAIQDGKDAGQTVKHVHIHVIPRAVQDFECNDDVYTEIERHEQKLFVDNETRTARSEAEMTAEATQLRHLFL